MNNFQKISFNEALEKSDYSEETKDKIKLFIYENLTKFEKNTEIILTYSFGKNIFVIRHILKIELKKIPYSIFILMYLTVDFPNNFRIYLQKVMDLGINRVYIEKQLIDPTTLELNYQNLINYKPLEKPITKLIEAILFEFSVTFPLYKSKKKEDYYGPCLLNDDKSFSIIMPKEDLKENTSLNELRNKLKSKIINLINNVSFEMQKTTSELDAVEEKIEQNLKDCSNARSKENIQLEKIIQTLQALRTNLTDEIEQLRNNNKTILHKCSEVVKIKDEEKFKYTVMKKTIEDYLKYIRRSMEKNLISLDEGIEQTRRLSKELFFILYIIQKKNNKDN
jgi:hypothetical protein